MFNPVLVFNKVHVADIVFYIMFLFTIVCRTASFFLIWPLCYMSFFDTWIMITPLVSNKLFLVFKLNLFFEGKENICQCDWTKNSYLKTSSWFIKLNVYCLSFFYLRLLISPLSYLSYKLITYYIHFNYYNWIFQSLLSFGNIAMNIIILSANGKYSWLSIFTFTHSEL